MLGLLCGQTYNALANAHALMGDLPRVESVVTRLGEAGLRPDRYTYGALLQASASSRDGDRQQRACVHVERLLRSSVILNDYLISACKRAVGEATFASLQRKRAAGRQGSTAGEAARNRPAAHDHRQGGQGPSNDKRVIADDACDGGGAGGEVGGGADEWVTQKSRRCRQHWSTTSRHANGASPTARRAGEPTTKVSPIRKTALATFRKEVPSGKPMRSVTSELALALSDEMKLE